MAIHLVEPAIHFAQPTIHVAHPAIQVAQPAIHVVQPAIHVVQPAIHFVQPAIHFAQPAIHFAQPAIHFVQPAIHRFLTPVHGAEQRFYLGRLLHHERGQPFVFLRCHRSSSAKGQRIAKRKLGSRVQRANVTLGTPSATKDQRSQSRAIRGSFEPSRRVASTPLEKTEWSSESPREAVSRAPSRARPSQ